MKTAGGLVDFTARGYTLVRLRDVEHATAEHLGVNYAITRRSRYGGAEVAVSPEIAAELRRKGMTA